MTNEQFAWKVFCEAPFIFLIGERGIDSKLVGKLFGENVYNLILEESSKLTEKEKDGFLSFHCDSRYPIAR